MYFSYIFGNDSQRTSPNNVNPYSSNLNVSGIVCGTDSRLKMQKLGKWNAGGTERRTAIEI